MYWFCDRALRGRWSQPRSCGDFWYKAYFRFASLTRTQLAKPFAALTVIDEKLSMQIGLLAQQFLRAFIAQHQGERTVGIQPFATRGNLANAGAGILENSTVFLFAFAKGARHPRFGADFMIKLFIRVLERCRKRTCFGGAHASHTQIFDQRPSQHQAHEQFEPGLALA